MSKLLKVILGVFFLSVAGLAVYSYALIDPNLTLINHPYWIAFRDPMVHLGYNMRSTSANIYIFLLVVLYLSHLFFVKKYKKLDPVRVSLIIGGILLFSYPLFSHDLFNYIFDAKILTFYGKNPYQYMPGDFYQDEWLRFMHWTDRRYPYGPSFLIISFLPSFLAMGKFILNFIFFKLLFVISYIVSVYILGKIHKRGAVLFATNPLILFEGVVNAHNDLISVTLGIVGIYYLWNNHKVRGKIALILSAGIKFLTLPIIILTKERKLLNLLAFIGQIALITYLSTVREIQPWYFLPLFIFLPIYPYFIDKIQIFLFGLLLAYYPYIRFGGWDTLEKVQIKHEIIYAFAIVNAFYLVVFYRSRLLGYFLKK